MTAPQPPHAPVLRRHRLEALLTEFPDCDKFGFSVETERWLEYGGTLFPCDNRIAQLAADCEARGKYEAWNEGYAQAEEDLDCDTDRTMRTENPYPKADEETEHG